MGGTETAKEANRVTPEEKTRLKEQLLAFVERVSISDDNGSTFQRMPEEVNALPAIIAMLRDGI